MCSNSFVYQLRSTTLQPYQTVEVDCVVQEDFMNTNLIYGLSSLFRFDQKFVKSNGILLPTWRGDPSCDPGAEAANEQPSSVRSIGAT